jgi:hypothetical protein
MKGVGEILETKESILWNNERFFHIMYKKCIVFLLNFEFTACDS